MKQRNAFKVAQAVRKVTDVEPGVTGDIALNRQFDLAIDQIRQDGSAGSRKDAVLNLLNHPTMSRHRKAFVDFAPNGLFGIGSSVRKSLRRQCALGQGQKRDLAQGHTGKSLQKTNGIMPLRP